MIRYLATAAMLLVSTTAFAQTTVDSSSGSSSGAQASSGVMINHGNGYRQAPSAIAPGLAASGLSCSGSASLGGSGAGWGISLGLTKEDRYCNAREDAKYIHGTTGDQVAAKERLCDISETRAAFARAGRPCYADRVRMQQTRTTRRGQYVIRQTSTAGYATDSGHSANWRASALASRQNNR